MAAVHRLVLVGLFSAGLAACQSTLAPQTGAGAAPSLLPDNYREQVAAHLVTQYLTDAEGPAEITQPSPGGRFLIRFPVQEEKARGVYFIRLGEGPRRRCLDVAPNVGLFTSGKGFRVESPKIDGWTTCGDGPWEPYAEMDRMASAIRACLARGEKTCALSVRPPEAKAAEALPPAKAKR